MTTATGPLPVAELTERARSAPRPGYVLATAVAGLLAGLGWLLGRSLVIAGWLGGRFWLSLAYMAEAVVFGFRSGAGLPPRDAPASPPDRDQARQ